MSKTDLEKIYIETTYSVFIVKECCDINIGKHLPQTLQYLISKEKSAAILTAWNPKSQALSLSENESRNIELKSQVKNYTVYKAVGQGTDSSWPGEESFFILGITKKEADILAVEFEQNAFVYCENDKPVNLIFTKFWYES